MFQKIKEYFSKKNILIGVLITVVSTFVTELSVSFINNLILPIFDRDGDDDKDPDINHLKKYNLKFNGVTFKVGTFMISLIKFIIVFLIIGVLINNLN